VHTPLLDSCIDIAVTLACWLYFTLGFVLVFLPFYLASAYLAPRPEDAVQRCNRFFYRGFFALLRTLTPRIDWEFDDRIGAIRSSVVVCNHRSYLDPLLLIALLDRARTIVKPVFFSVPIFGWAIRAAGYLPASAEGRLAGLMLARMESMGTYLAQGGNLFVFPEGTRNRGETVGPLAPGALKIARQHRVPIQVVCLEQTDQVFTPGRFFFHTRQPVRIRVRLTERIDPHPDGTDLARLVAQVQTALNRCLPKPDQAVGDCPELSLQSKA
jgi:1-acyl-sn-glycerol-3-phosphate acyltransferase